MNLKNICLIMLIIGVLAIGAVSADDEITFMAEMMSGFTIDNKDLEPI